MGVSNSQENLSIMSGMSFSARGPGARCLGSLALHRFLLEFSKSADTLATVLFEFRDSPTMLLKIKYLGATWRV